MFYPIITTLLLLGCLTAQAGTLSGEFKFKKKPPKIAVVYFSEDHSLKKDPLVDQKNKKFTQKVVVGAKNSAMIFKNSDSVEHNIFAHDRKKKVNFDIGLAPPNSKLKEIISWDHESAVQIGCKIHPKMRAWVFSLDSQYNKAITFNRKKKKLKFDIPNVPDNLSKIKVWIPKYKAIEVDLKKGSSVDIELKRKKKKKGTLHLVRN
jgi:hypothetical protein